MAKTKNDKDTVEPTDVEEGPEAEGQKGAATLEEAMAQSDALARGQSAEAAEESGEAKAEADAEAEAAIAEAGAAQEARDDEVYGRTPADTTEADTLTGAE